MRIDQLIYLIEISHSRSLNLAADALHISTQALSASIKNLENELGTEILHRTNRGVSLTDDGQRVLHYAQSTVDGYKRLLEELSNDPQTRTSSTETLTGSLELYSAPAFLESLVPAMLQEFHRVYPNIHLSVDQCSTREICTHLQTGAPDKDRLGLVILPCDKDGLMRDFLPAGHYHFQPINISRFVCCVPKDSPFARNKTISLNKVLKQPIVIYTTGIAENSPLLHRLRKYSDHIQVASVVSSINFWAKSIKNHLGIGFLNDIFLHPQSMVKDAFDDLVFIKLKEPLISLNGFIYTDPLSPVAKKFMAQFPNYHPTKSDPPFCQTHMEL